MKVILRDDVKDLGDMGTIVDVSDGYARNYLVPKGLAVAANVKSVKALEHEKRIIQGKAKKIKHAAEDLSERVSKMSLVIKSKSGEEGKLFGSVTTMDIAELLQKEGVEIDKKRISLDEPIKRLGSYTVNVKLHPEIATQLQLEVLQEE
jgi:large subunit ribosomal protein L9